MSASTSSDEKHDVNSDEDTPSDDIDALSASLGDLTVGTTSIDLTGLHHRTPNDPSQFGGIITGTPSGREINRAFQNHYHENIWCMDSNCCVGHGRYTIQFRLTDPGTFRFYRTVSPTGYLYQGDYHTFRNTILFPSSINVNVLGLRLQKMTPEELKDQKQHEHVAIPIPKEARIPLQMDTNGYFFQSSDVMAAWQRYETKEKEDEKEDENEDENADEKEEVISLHETKENNESKTNTASNGKDSSMK